MSECHGLQSQRCRVRSSKVSMRGLVPIVLGVSRYSNGSVTAHIHMRAHVVLQGYDCLPSPYQSEANIVNEVVKWYTSLSSRTGLDYHSM